jgi:putative chitinase
MKISEHFTLEELLVSSVADAHGIANTPLPAHLAAMKTRLAPGLELVRTICGARPIRIKSAYRNPAINRLVGGTPTSAHPLGYAADIVVAGLSARATAGLIAAAMKAGTIRIDQLILESGRGVVHVSFDPRARGMRGHQPGVAGTPIDWGYFA